MFQTSQPNVKLNGIEYLLLSIQSNPGKSQRWHLRRKHMYLHGRPDYHKGGTGSGYFNSPSYRNILWRDRAPMDVVFPAYNPVDGFFQKAGPCKGLRSKCAQMHLTWSGWVRANEARKKIGLDPIPMECFDD